MWTCKKCKEKHNDEFDACWKCGYVKSGVKQEAKEEQSRLDENKMKKENDGNQSSNEHTGLLVDIENIFGKAKKVIDSGNLETLYVYEKKLIIAPRKSLLGKLEGGSHEIIYLKHIKDIEFKYGGGLLNGYIQFRTSSSGNTKKGGMLSVLETANDPNTIHFRKKANDQMFEVLKFVNKYIEENQYKILKKNETPLVQMGE